MSAAPIHRPAVEFMSCALRSREAPLSSANPTGPCLARQTVGEGPPARANAMASTGQFELNEPEGQNGSPRLGGATGHPAQADGELNPLRVAVVAGVRLVREGLSRILGGEPGIALVEPASLLRASSAEAEVHPHVVIADSALVRT